MSQMVRIFLPALLLASAMATPSAGAQTMKDYLYQPEGIYEIRTGLGITTQIVLDPADEVQDYSTGFSSGWDLNRRNNVFYIKPKDVDVDTNMMVRTAKRSYIFELKVVATDWKSLEQAKTAGVQYKVSFRYPKQKTDDTAPAQISPLSTRLEKGRHYNFDYSYSTRSKAPWLIPTTVYDDGRFTYIQMSDMARFPTANFPTVYGRESARSADFVVNSTIENNMIVVHGTYRFLVIRHGKNVVGLRRNAQ